MVFKVSLVLVLLSISAGSFDAVARAHDHRRTNSFNSNTSSLAGIKLPDHMSFNAVSSSTNSGCSFSKSNKPKHPERIDTQEKDGDVALDDDDGDDLLTLKPSKQKVKIHLKHRSKNRETEPKKSVSESTIRDLTRIQALHRRIIEKKNQNTVSRLKKESQKSKKQIKPVVTPAASPESYASGVSGQLVATLESGVSLGAGEYFMDVFVVNLSTPTGKSEFRQVENVMFGCGHWNRGLFHGAAGLLGLGRGPLSFSSQLQSLYGHSFSYCLVDRNSDTNVSSKLIFGEDKDLLNHPNLNFTSLVSGKENPVDTFYYLQIKSIIVGGEVLSIPDETWRLSPEGAGGTIIDSGTTLSYFAEPAYQIIKQAFMKKVKGYPLVKDFPILDPCYNVSGIEKMELPEFGIQFADGGVWNFPVENYFIRLDPEDVVCLAILGTPRSALSIIGNYQQQNFHILYDTKNSRLGYAPMRCADI